MKKRLISVLTLAMMLTLVFVSKTEKASAAGEVVLGDILVRHDGTNDDFTTMHDASFKVKPNDTLEFTSTLCTRQIKQQLFSLPVVKNNLISGIKSDFTIDIVFPAGLDISGVDTAAVKDTYGDGLNDPRVLRYDPLTGTYSQSYTAPSSELSEVIDTNYHNDNVGAFYISSVTVTGNTMKVIISLNTESYYTAPNNTLGADTTYAGYLLAAVKATPDYLALTIPGVKVAASFDQENPEIVKATVNGNFSARKSWFPISYSWAGEQDENVPHPDGNYSGRDVLLTGNEKTIQASLTANMHTVTFDSAGGSPVAPQKVWDGDTANDVTPTKPGNQFKGWYLGGNAYTFTSEVHSDLQLVAQWQPVSTPTPSTPTTPTTPTNRVVPNTAVK